MVGSPVALQKVTVAGLRHLEIGSTVEIQTDEKDFVDVFFSATVIPSKHKHKKKNQIYVEYHDLLASEGSTDLLKEYVDVSFVRPLPPQEIVTVLSPNDVVDAFYNDGWWTGVVNRVLKGSERFIVKFQTPPDELEFGLSDIRIHWDWLHGNWSRKSMEAEAASVTAIGGIVEVSRDDEKIHYSWFRSTIVNNDNEDLLVEFSTLKDSGGENIRANVHSRDVRPCPPHLKESPFLVGDKVDAYFNFGWRTGVVNAVVDAGKYLVFITHTKTAKLCHQAQLRPRVEWEGGKWIISSSKFSMFKQNTPQSSTANSTVTTSKDSGDKMKDCDGSTPKSRKHAKSQPANQKPLKVTPPLSKRRNDPSDSQDAPLRTFKRHKEGNVVGESEQDKRHDSSITKRAPDSPSAVAADDQSSGVHSREKTNQTKEREHITTQNSDRVEPPSSRIITKISQGKEPSTDVVSSVSGGSSRGAKNRSSKSKGKKPVSDQKKHPDHVTIQKLKDSTLSETQASSNKRKRERQPKEVQTPLKASKNGNGDEENGIAAKDGLTTHESDQHIIAEKGEEASLTNKECMLLATDYHQPSTLICGSETSPKSSSEKLISKSIGLQPNGSTERGSKPVDGQTLESQVEGEKSLVPNPLTNRSAIKTTSPKSSGEKLVNESMGLLPDGSTERESKSVEGQSLESQVEVKKLLVPDPPTNGSATETTSPKGNGEKLVNESMGLQLDGSTKGGSKPVDRQTLESQIEGEESLVPVLPTNGEKLVKESMDLQPDESSERGSKPVGTRTSESQVEGAPGSKTVEVIVMGADEDIMKEPLCNVIEGIKKASVRKKTETSEQTPNSTEKISVDNPDEQQTLPFAKNTFLWQTIESMEVFKQSPQKPHFQPLKQQKTSLREGMAIGYMVNFSNAIEKVAKLQLGDPDSIASDILDTLTELEAHGFDVGFVRDRVVGFVALRDKQRKHVVEANKLESQIVARCNEKCSIEHETSMIREELQRLQEKAAVAQLALDNENDRIAALQAQLLETKQGIENVEREFQGIAFSKY